MDRVFSDWLKQFRSSISDYKYYVDFPKVYQNVDAIKVELNILNSLIGSENIENDFKSLIAKYPQILKCIPILLAVRNTEIEITEPEGQLIYNFGETGYSIDSYIKFLRDTGLFDLISKHLINNLYDYVTGVEVGLDSNGRKNRGGHLMENLVESYIKEAGFAKDVSYYKEMYIYEIENKWGIDLSEISNDGKAEKRFDFVIKTDKQVFLIETNFYASGGSKLNETARSYKTLSLECEKIPGVTFVWFTDGKGWDSARNNLEETFDVMENIYNIEDLRDGVISKITKI